MKIQRYGFAYGEVHKDSSGNYYKRSDILQLLNPWHDAEKEKPEDNEIVLVKIENDFYTAFFDGTEWVAWELFSSNESIECVSHWMHIPKNEGEE